jgi:hypothetical protein
MAAARGPAACVTEEEEEEGSGVLDCDLLIENGGDEDERRGAAAAAVEVRWANWSNTRGYFRESRPRKGQNEFVVSPFTR